MAKQQSDQFSSSSPSAPGLPSNAEFFTLDKFMGLNTKATRQSIEEQEFSWCENFIPIGEGNLRTLYNKGSTNYTAAGGKTIIYTFEYNIGSTQYSAVFLSDGTADQVRLSDNAVTHITTTPNTFYNGGDLPAAQQYGSSGIIIVTTASVNGYYAWDGTLYSPTNAAPTWLSGLSTPFTPTGNTHTSTTIDTISSMTGIESGMSVTGSGIPANTTVVSVNVAGSSIVISQATSTSLSTTPLTFTWAIPSGVSGTSVENYNSHVWVINGNRNTFSAPSNGANFATADGGGSYTSTDSFLKQKFVQIKQTSGFLYVFGDSSINSISNVQSSGSPLTTTFNNLNVDPQVGTPWRDSVVEFGEGLVFANTGGVYVLYGGTARKISDKLDGFFAKANLPLSGSNIPTASVSIIFGIKCYVLLIPGAVDYLNVSRPLMVIWDGKKWFIASQTVALTFISIQEVSSNLTTYGTDGTSLFPIFSTASSSLNKILQSKLWNGQSYLFTKQALRCFLQIQDNSGSGVNTTLNTNTEVTSVMNTFTGALTIAFVNNAGGVLQFQNNSLANLNFTVPSDNIIMQNDDITGQLLGITLSTQANDATLISTGLIYKTVKALY